MQSDHFVNVGRIKVTYRRCKLSNSLAWYTVVERYEHIEINMSLKVLICFMSVI